MFRKFIDRLAHIILKPSDAGAAVVISVYTIIWGLWVSNPFWDVFSSAALYDGLAGFGEIFWGGTAIFCGAFSLYSIYKHMPRTIFTFSALTGWHWLLVGILYFYGDWHNTGGITAIFLAVLCAYLYLNSKANNGFL